MNKRHSCRTSLCTVSLLLLVPLCVSGPDVTRAEDAPGGKSALTAPKPKENPDKGLTRLSSRDQCWVDFKHQLVIVNGKICQRRGLLEMFACPLDTKDHESIVCVYSRAFVIHTALLAVGAVPGAPVKYVPEYESAHGTEVEGARPMPAQQGPRLPGAICRIGRSWLFPPFRIGPLLPL